MNRSIGTDTIVATPEASIWFAGAFRPSRGPQGADRLPSERHEDRSVHPHQGEHAGEPAASLESTLVHIGLIKIDGTQVYPTSQAQPEAPPKTHPRRSRRRYRHGHRARQREPEAQVEQEPALAASF